MKVRNNINLACPNLNYYYYEYFTSNNIPLSCVYFIFGLYLSFLANINKKISTLILSQVLFVNLLGFFFYILTNNNIKGGIWMIIIWYLISSIFTFLYGYMLFYKKKYHYLLHGFLAFVISYYFTVFFYFLFLRYIVSNPYFVFWITYVFIFLIAGTYHFSSIEFSKRTSVALLGGFLITKSLGNIIGGFPSETLVITLLENMEYKQLSFKLNNFIYIYLGGWMIIFITSQVYYNTKKSEIYDTSLEENAINHILVNDEN